MVETLTSVLTESGELPEFMAGVADELGDPAATVCEIFVPWYPDITKLRDIRPKFNHRKRILSLDFTGGNVELPIPISEDCSASIIDGEIESYGLRKVCSGVWALAPSLFVPGMIHAYVVFHGVPDPAPWESTILVVTESDYTRMTRLTKEARVAMEVRRG